MSLKISTVLNTALSRKNDEPLALLALLLACNDAETFLVAFLESDAKDKDVLQIVENELRVQELQPGAYGELLGVLKRHERSIDGSTDKLVSDWFRKKHKAYGMRRIREEQNRIVGTFQQWIGRKKLDRIIEMLDE